MNRQNPVVDYADAHVGVYQVLDQVLASTAVPPGAKGAMFSIIDHLRSTSSPVEDVLRAERISIELHKLEGALRRADDMAVRGARGALKLLAVAWLDARVSTKTRSAGEGVDRKLQIERRQPPGLSPALHSAVGMVTDGQ